VNKIEKKEKITDNSIILDEGIRKIHHSNSEDKTMSKVQEVKMLRVVL
jgi:hypothetical protein